MAKTLTVYLAADLRKFSGNMRQAERQVSGFGSSLKNVMGPALIGAAAAAGAFAVKLGVDGVKAAIEDEKATATLAKTLQNLNKAHETDAVEAYIGSLETLYGVADDQLRPSYAALIRATGDVNRANDLLALSLDVAAGTGQSLEATVKAISRAYQGNTTGLSKLNAGLDKATLKTGDMDVITEKLSDTFGGMAATSASTYEGQLKRLEIGAGNLQEAFGYGLLNALGDTDAKTGDLVDTMKELEPIIQGIGTAIGEDLSDWAYLVDVVMDLKSQVEGLVPELARVGDSASTSDRAFQGLFDSINPLSGKGGINTLVDSIKLLKEQFSESDGVVTDWTNTVLGADIAGGQFQTTLQDLTPELEANKDTAAEAAGSYQTLFEKIEASRIAARDLATTSGTVTSALAAGLLDQYLVPQGRLPTPKYQRRQDRINARREAEEREREAERLAARYDPPRARTRDEDRDARAAARGVKTRVGAR